MNWLNLQTSVLDSPEAGKRLPLAGLAGNATAVSGASCEQGKSHGSRADNQTATLAAKGSPASTGSPLLAHAQACFMEWIKIVEFELGTADGHFYAAENALRAGNLTDFGTAFGLAHGHMQNALKTIRSATKRGFDEGNNKAQEST